MRVLTGAGKKEGEWKTMSRPCESNLYLVDNADESRSVRRYLTEWCPISKQLDVATGYLEIGGLLSLDTYWQQLDKVRIILGSEVTPRTGDVLKKAAAFFMDGMKRSLDAAQAKDDFLVGVPAILDALKSRKIECRVFDRGKFHAKAYITDFKDAYRARFPASLHVPSGYALVGSSNFTAAGLTKNIELNVQLKDNVDELKDWFEQRWNEAADVTDAVLEVVERHCREYSPYDVYCRAMYEQFKSREESVSEWEQRDSAIYPVLSQYQRDGYNNLVEIAGKYSGAFLCDGVGLGKTFEGLMLIERFVRRERRKTVLLVPAAARVSVWETTIRKYMPDVLEGFSPFKILNHTDLLLEKNAHLMKQVAEQAEVVVVDEAHHFRNQASSRYRKLMEIMKTAPRKQLFMLTATPVNNSLRDLQHMIELFTLQDDAFFAQTSLGVHSLAGHFKKLEARLEAATGSGEVDLEVPEDLFSGDPLVSALVVQRSRAFVKRSLAAEGGGVLFPVEKLPIAAGYSLRRGYGRLVDDFISTCSRHDRRTGRPTPILALAIYSPYETAYFTGDPGKVDPMKVGRQNQVVNLVRQLLLKRFESSVAAFQDTCVRIYARLRKFVSDYRASNEHAVERLFAEQADVIAYVEDYIKAHTKAGTVEDFEDDLPDYVWEVEEDLDEADFNIAEMVIDTVMDLQTLGLFINDMIDLDPADDDKLNALKRLLAEEPRLAGQKVIVFTEYRSTAKYLEKALVDAGFKGVFEVDGQSAVDRHEMVQRFAPYYNGKSSGEVKDEIRILIATDVLSEGLNLQDASRLVNYELHWNPVRLMQRIGRVDRRRSLEVETRLLSDHPALAADRDRVCYWNFLPPDELEQLLGLYQTVARKTLRISKLFGIEGKKLLTEADDYDALGDFNAQYEGSTSPLEEVALAYLQLLKENPGYPEKARALPQKTFSGKASDSPKGYFFCYALPTKTPDASWSTDNADCRWLLCDAAGAVVATDVKTIWQAIRCARDTPRVLTASAADFASVRKKVEAHLRNTYFKAANAPLSVGPRLVTWMQLV